MEVFARLAYLLWVHDAIEDAVTPRDWMELWDRHFTSVWASYIGAVNGMHTQWRRRWLK